MSEVGKVEEGSGGGEVVAIAFEGEEAEGSMCHC